MLKCKYLIMFFLSVSVMCNLFLLYGWVDRSITLSYSEQSFDDCANDLSLLKIMLKNELKGNQKALILHGMNVDGLKDSILLKDNEVYLGYTEFIFKDGILINVE